jgi:hypothetical protein
MNKPQLIEGKVFMLDVYEKYAHMQKKISFKGNSLSPK